MAPDNETRPMTSSESPHDSERDGGGDPVPQPSEGAAQHPEPAGSPASPGESKDGNGNVGPDFTADDLAEARWWVVDIAGAAAVVYTMVSTLTAFSPRATVGDPHPDGADPATFILMMSIAMLLLGNGMRRIFRGCNSATFEKSAVTLAACGIWLAILVLITQHLFYVDPYGLLVWPFITAVVMIPVSICLVLAHRGLCRELAESQAANASPANGNDEADTTHTARPMRTVAFWSNFLWLGIVLALCAMFINADRRRPVLGDDPTIPLYFGLHVLDYPASDSFVSAIDISGIPRSIMRTDATRAIASILLPPRWHPGLSASVKWQRCPNVDHAPGASMDDGCKWISKEILVHPYTEITWVRLHIFEDDEVLLVPTTVEFGSADYPASAPPCGKILNPLGAEESECI